MPSIINGLFSGRSGIASHGLAIAVVGDNISNASTIGYKASRTEFEDLIAGGQTAGKVVGSGSSVSAVTNIFDQGTLEFTGRDLDLAIDGNGFFIVDNGGARNYTRAGNFKIDASGALVDQKGQKVLGFPEGGSGALEVLTMNSVAQDNVGTENVSFSGNLDATKTILKTDLQITTAEASFQGLSAIADFSSVVKIFDSLGASHTLTMYFFKTANADSSATPPVEAAYQVRAYADGGEVAGGTAGTPVRVSGGPPFLNMTFDGAGARTNSPVPPASDFTFDTTVRWKDGADADAINFNFDPFTSYATDSTISSITGDGDGVGAITSLSIDRDGRIFAVLNNGQSSVIGTVALANFANPEGLTRVGSNLLQESADSGAPIIGKPGTGTFGKVESGSIELSTVDIAGEFVKMITLQRGFQANSRIITTINQLLNEIINLA